MAKLFTITEGLENLGAIRTGGQGSVYKGKRIGEIITAIKLLPTPIDSEDPSSKHYIDFQNEVQKLKKVNEEPNPNVVTILGSGITETGGFPFIEMEFIEGPDLGELLKPPHQPVFSLKETIKVAEHLAHALAHCHKQNVKHGDIKSNNVKYNIHTGNYVLLDFGLAVMSDEERRTSLRRAGAIEFMAPEQNEGQMLFQSDIYSFGIIIYELLAGQVPFPLQDNGETSRNHVRLAHIEMPVPDLLPLRIKNLPEEWSDAKKEMESELPGWMLTMVKKCLEKNPSDRFNDGTELYEYICLNSALEVKKDVLAAEGSDQWQKENEKLLVQRDHLQEQLLEYQRDLSLKDKELQELRSRLQRKEELIGIQKGVSNKKIISKPAFYAMMMMGIVLAGLAFYGLFFRNDTSPALTQNSLTVTDSLANYKDSMQQVSIQENAAKKRARPQRTKTEENRDSLQQVQNDVLREENTKPASHDSSRSQKQETDTSQQDQPME